MPFVPFSEEEIAQQKRKQKPKVYEAARFVPFTDAEIAARSKTYTYPGNAEPVEDVTGSAAAKPTSGGRTGATSSGTAVSVASSAKPLKTAAKGESEGGLLPSSFRTGPITSKTEVDRFVQTLQAERAAGLSDTDALNAAVDHVYRLYGVDTQGERSLNALPAAGSQLLEDIVDRLGLSEAARSQAGIGSPYYGGVNSTGKGDYPFIRPWDERTTSEESRAFQEKERAEEFVGDVTPGKAALLGVGSGMNRVSTGLEQLKNILQGDLDPVQKNSMEYIGDVVNENGSGLEKGLFSLTDNITAMAPSMLAGGPAGVMLTGLTSGANSYRGSRLEGYDAGESLLYGVVNGALESALQYALGGLKGLGKGGFSKALAKTPLKDTLSRATAKVIKSVPMQNFLKSAASYSGSMLDEGFEEYVQALLDPVVRNVILNEQNSFEPFSEDKLYAAMMGALTAGLMNLPVSAAQAVTSRNSGFTSGGNRGILETNGGNGYAGQQVQYQQPSEEASGGYAGVSGQTLAGDYSGTAQGQYDRRADYRGVGLDVAQSLQNQGITPVAMAYTGNADSFHQAIGRAKQNNDHGAFVTQHEVSEYANDALFLSQDGNVGVAVTPDGDIVSVFKNPQGKVKGAVSSILLTALENGGVKLDNFGSKSLSTMYWNHGFIPVARTAFDPEFAPTDWNYARDGQPDIIFWVHNGEDAQTVAQKIGDYGDLPDLSKLPLMSYDEAAVYRDNILRQRADAGNTGSAFFNAQNPQGSARSRAVSMSGQRSQSQNVDMSAQGKRARARAVYETGTACGVDPAILDTAAKLAENTGRRIEFVQTLGEGRNGKYDAATGTLYVAADSGNPLLTILKHELTHSIEGTKAYEELSSYILDTIVSESGISLDDIVRAKIRQYAQRGEKLDTQGAIAELVADYVGDNLFTSEAAIRRLSAEKPSVARRILNWLRSLKTKLAGTAEEKALARLEKLYHEALMEPFSKGDGVQYKLNPNFQQEYDAWDGKKTGFSLHVGTTSEALQSIGVNDQNIYWDAGKILRIKNKHPDMTDSVIKQVPQLLENPVVIAYSGGYDSRISLLGEVYDEAGKPVLAALELIPTNNKMEIGDFIKIASAYGKDNAQNYLHNNEILYLDPDKKRTDSWLRHNGLQLPVGVTNYGSIKRIAYQDGKVKVVNPTPRNAMQAAFQKAEAAQQQYMQDDGENSRQFYDMTKIREVPDTSVEPDTSLVRSSPTFRNLSSGSSVPQSTDGVNTSISETAPDDTRASLGVSSGDTIADIKAMVEKYGAIKPGEAPARDVQIPRQTNDGTRVRQFVRTAAEAAQVPDSFVGGITQDVMDEVYNYVPISNQEAMNRAVNTVEKLGIDKALEQWEAAANGAKGVNKYDMALGEYLLTLAGKNNDPALASKLIVELSTLGTEAGQAVQAMSMLKRMTPEGKLMALQRIADRLSRESKGEAVKIPEPIIDRMQRVNPTDTETADRIFHDGLVSLAEQVPPTLLDKWNAWRYLAMLGNPRTHIRNIVGNAVFTPVVGIKNTLAGAIEGAMDAASRAAGGKGIARTKTALAALPFTKRREYLDFARQSYRKNKEKLDSGSRLNPADIVRDNRPVFTSKLGKPVEAARKANSRAMQAEDGWFKRLHYERALIQYLAANKIDLSKLDAQTQNRAENYAMREAQKATFADDSAFANFLSRAAKSNKGAGLLIEGIAPFKKTPVNIAKRAIEYSPAGLLDTVTRGAYRLKKGDISAAEFIDGLASGLTGTGIVALGMWLASKGLLTGGLGYGDEDELARLQGAQEYALNLDDTSYTLDWAAPAALPLFVGAEIYNLFRESEKGEVPLPKMLEALTNLSEPMVNMSMLQGINDAIENVKYSDSELTDLMLNTLVGYAGQGVPTLFGQIARTMDDTRRRNYVEQGSAFPRLQTELQRNKSKIPGALQTQQPYVDAWGREEPSGSLAQRVFDNFISPGYTSRLQDSAMEEELRRLYGQTGEGGVLPSAAGKSLTYQGEKYALSAEEYTQYQRTAGRTAYDMLESLTGSSAYRSLSEEQKVKAVGELYDYAADLAKEEMLKGRGVEYTPSSAREKLEAAKRNGIAVPMYLLFQVKAGELKADKKPNGDPIQGSKKRKVEALIREMGVTGNQRQVLLALAGYGSEAQRERILSGESGGSGSGYGYLETDIDKLLKGALS